MTGLAPNERLSGSPQAQHDLVGRLAALRASPGLDRHHSELSFATLSDVLRRSPPLVDPDVFSAGWAILARRYATLGLRRLLPMERVWVGTSSSQAAAFVTIFKSPTYCARYQGEGPKRSTACATASFGVYPAEKGSRTPVVIAGETV